MLDIKFVRNNPQAVKAALAKRGNTVSIEAFLSLDEGRRKRLVDVEQLKNKRNVVSQEIGKLKQSGQPAEDLVLEMRNVSQQIKDMDEEIKQIEEKLEYMILTIPNMPNESVPVGTSDADNLEVRKWGEPRKFAFEPQAHWDIGEALDILDFERGSKVTGARFTFYKGLGARLERALINFMLDLHTGQHGYTEIFPPFMVHRDSMVGTGQLVPSVVEASLQAGLGRVTDSLDGRTVGLMPVVNGEVVTEIQALRILYGVEAFQLAGGGIGGAEGSVVLVARGTASAVEQAKAGLAQIKGEPPYGRPATS